MIPLSSAGSRIPDGPGCKQHPIRQLDFSGKKDIIIGESDRKVFLSGKSEAFSGFLIKMPGKLF